ncbi:hypothetical protein [Microtetraspora fusca]|uniref:hypothetical protein n=1 Tax=Microtetraspora fusca TaxID=1997 RepID=UPI001471AA5B|nr:hypothetical protein [Microtetraspora fusca]
MSDSFTVPDAIIVMDATYVGGVLAVSTAALTLPRIKDSTMSGQPLRIRRR